MIILKNSKNKVLIASDEARVVIKYIEDKCTRLLNAVSKELLLKDTWNFYDRHEYLNTMLEERVKNNNKLLYWESLKVVISDRFLDRNMTIKNDLGYKCSNLNITIESKTI